MEVERDKAKRTTHGEEVEAVEADMDVRAWYEAVDEDEACEAKKKEIGMHPNDVHLSMR